MFAESRNQAPPFTFFADFLLKLGQSALTPFEVGNFPTLSAFPSDRRGHGND